MEVKFLVSFILPPNVSVEDAKDYVYNRIALRETERLSLRDPMNRLDQDSVRVKLAREVTRAAA